MIENCYQMVLEGEKGGWRGDPDFPTLDLPLCFPTGALSLLYGSLKEASSNEITLEETPANAFGFLLKYLYTGQLPSGAMDIQV